MSSFSDQDSSASLNDPSSTESNLLSTETTMSLLEVNCLISFLDKSNYFLEFGSGYSTLLAVGFPGISIVSLESNQAYVKFMQEQISLQGIRLAKIEFVHLDIGLTKEWGWPSNTSSKSVFPNYLIGAMSELRLRDFSPDLVLIDGRFRVASFLWCFLMFPKVDILFDDYLERDHYHVVEEVLRLKKKVGRIGIFRVPRKISRKKTLRALELILDYSYDPS